MRFRGILRARDGTRLGPWLDQAYHSGIYALQRFARALQGDLDAVRNAITEPWSNGQTEGHISRLKTMKRSMYLIENFFSKLKEFKRMAMRSDKTVTSLAAMIHLGATVINSR